MKLKLIAKVACLAVGLMWGISSERSAQAVTCWQLVNCTGWSCSKSKGGKCKVVQTSAINRTKVATGGGHNLQNTLCGKLYPWKLIWCDDKSNGECAQRTSATLC
jgi:hypothetical protein